LTISPHSHYLANGVKVELGLINSNRFVWRVDLNQFGKANQTQAYFDSTHQFREVLKPSSVGELVFLRASWH